MSIKDELAEVFAADDQWRKQHEAWMARRNAAASPPVRKNDEPDIVYRGYDGNASAAFPPAASEPSDDDPELGDAIERFAAACESRFTELDAELLKRDRRIGELEGELREIRGMLGAMTLLGGQPKPKLWTP